MANVENDLEIYLYYAVGNANTQKQENELATILKKSNSAGWKLISTSTVKVDTKNQFLKLLSILENEIVINSLDNSYLLL
tara:strand:+ start:314 stop:553 length:240 start_codon:yes stop_codon:yes gene_type:complete